MSTAYITDSASEASSWANLSDDQQLDVTRAALHTAIQIIAGQADMLAEEMEDGVLLDRGGPDALRLLACALRASSEETGSTPPARIASYDLGAMQPMGYA